MIDGHAPGLMGGDLEAYAGAGIMSDHESTRPDEAREKLRAGMTLMIREGSVAHNMEDLLALAHGASNERCLLVSDDLLPGDLLDRRHLAGLLARAVKSGMDPVGALRMVTLNPANHFRLRDMGRIVPGARADLVVFRDLYDFHAEMVIHGGRIAARQGSLEVPVESSAPVPGAIARSMHVAALSERSFGIPSRPGHCRVIRLVPDQLLTEQLWMDPPIQDGLIHAAPYRDLAKIAVIERHRASGHIGLGMVTGFGLMHGALASSVSHDAHNLVVIGVNDRDMLLAAREVIRLGGGLAAASMGQLLGSLALPIAGLISDLTARHVASELADLETRTRRLGTLPEHPFMALSFMTLSVIPSLKITAQWLVDKGRVIGF